MPALRWRISEFPELGHLPEDERRALLRQCVGARTYTRLIGQAVFVGIVAGGALWAGLARSAPPWLLAAGVPAALVGASAAWYQLILWRIRISVRTQIMDGFAGQRVPVCLRCGYDVAGVRGDRCPECGAPIHGPDSETRRP
jgi:hypothetical protein